MAKWKEHLADGGSSAAQPMNNWLGGRCEHCYAKEGQYHHPMCDTQLKRQQDESHGDPVDDDAPDDEEWVKVTVRSGYNDLFIVLQQALWQAQDGKGAERHGNGQPFTDQPVLTISRAVGLGFPLGQAMKKIQECQRMDLDAAKRELLGAINYLAAAILFLDE
jgi:hypothetical protein